MLFVYVYDSAGVGRTGTYIVVDQLMEKLSRQYCEIDIFGVILKLRNERVNMVQTEVRYIYYKVTKKSLLAMN